MWATAVAYFQGAYMSLWVGIRNILVKHFAKKAIKTIGDVVIDKMADTMKGKDNDRGNPSKDKEAPH